MLYKNLPSKTIYVLFFNYIKLLPVIWKQFWYALFHSFYENMDDNSEELKFRRLFIRHFARKYFNPLKIARQAVMFMCCTFPFGAHWQICHYHIEFVRKMWPNERPLARNGWRTLQQLPNKYASDQNEHSNCMFFMRFDNNLVRNLKNPEFYRIGTLSFCSFDCSRNLLFMNTIKEIDKSWVFSQSGGKTGFVTICIRKQV